MCVDTLRTLAIDAVEKASSGHPGTPMGMAPVGCQLWQRLLRFGPGDPIWPGRDRFAASERHASILLYALVHLAQKKAVNPAYETVGRVSVTLEDVKSFRELGSRCPGLTVSLETFADSPRFALGSPRALATLQADAYDDDRDMQRGKIEHEVRHGELAVLHLVPRTPAPVPTR